MLFPIDGLMGYCYGSGAHYISKPELLSKSSSCLDSSPNLKSDRQSI
jgi:hypothetical protein